MSMDMAINFAGRIVCAVEWEQVTLAAGNDWEIGDEHSQ